MSTHTFSATYPFKISTSNHCRIFRKDTYTHMRKYHSIYIFNSLRNNRQIMSIQFVII